MTVMCCGKKNSRSGHSSPMVGLFRGNAGLSLLEMMFAVAILSVALVSVISAIISSYEANVITRQRTVAFEIARAALDEIRVARSEGVTVPAGIKEKFSTDERKLANDLLKSATQTLSFSAPQPGMLFINVDVAWDDLRGRRAHVVLSTGLSNYE